MIYGTMNMRGSIKILLKNIRIADVEQQINWAVAHESDGRYHYHSSVSYADEILWEFEKEEDATLFALKFK